MTRSSLPVSPWAVRALYLFAFVLMAMPVLDFITSVMPARWGDLNWRYGSLGLMPGYLHTPMLGLTLALALGYAQRTRWVLRFGGMLATLAAVLLLLCTGLFTLDVLQMRSMRPEAALAITAGAALQGTKYVTGAVVLALLGYGAMVTGGRIQAAASGSGHPGIVSKGRSAS